MVTYQEGFAPPHRGKERLCPYLYTCAVHKHTENHLKPVRQSHGTAEKSIWAFWLLVPQAVVVMDYPHSF